MKEQTKILKINKRCRVVWSRWLDDWGFWQNSLWVSIKKQGLDLWVNYPMSRYIQVEKYEGNINTAPTEPSDEELRGYYKELKRKKPELFK